MASADRFPARDVPPPLPAAAPLLRQAAQGALVESRQRWRDLAGLASDMAFETDARGRLTFLSPDRVLGWPAEALLGRSPQEDGLLLRPEPDPFTLTGPARDVRAWLRRADGGTACLSFAVVPLLDPFGRHAGLRGCARDVTEEVAQDTAQAEALRRALALGALVRRVREAVLAPRMLPVLLDLLPVTLGCDGAMLAALPGPDQPAAPRAGTDGGDASCACPVADLAPMLADLADAPSGVPRFVRSAGGEIVALVPQPEGPRGRGGSPHRREALVVWRMAGGRAFDADDRHMLQAVSDLLAVLLGNHRLLAELEHQARTEPLTGLLNRRAFLDELRRRTDRLRMDGLGGALLFVDVDHLKPVNDRLGHEAGDSLLRAVARVLREAARGSDLVARLGGDEFALWLDGAGSETVATARAAAICAAAADTVLPAPALPEAAGTSALLTVSVSLGIAVTAPGDPFEPPDSVLARADAAMYDAKRAGRNTWRLARPAAAGAAP